MNKPCARITLDLQQASTPTFVAVKKSDIGREIRITLSDGGFSYEISADCYAVLTGTKPDGNILYNHCDIEGNTIVYTVTEQTTAAAGRMKAEVKLYGADDILVTSATFRIIIDGTVYDEGKVESKDEVSALTHLVSEAASVINNGNQMIEQGQQTIQSAETATQQATNAAEQAENSAADADTAAGAATQASNDANTAAGKANTAAQNADTAASKANTAAANAGDAAVSATNATGSAISAAGNANDAAATANAAAASASAAASEAVSAAKRAEEAADSINSSGGNVAYDEEQKLTDEQKARARANIGAQPAGNYLTETEIKPVRETANSAQALAEQADKKVDALREVVSKFHSNIVEEASGKTITLDDASDMELAGLRIFGKTTQKTTTGKNLLKNAGTSSTANGVTFTVNDDGCVTANGTSTDRATVFLGKTTCPAGEYVFSQGLVGNANGAVAYLKYMRGDTAVYVDLVNVTEKRFTLTEMTDVECTCEVRTAGATVNNIVFKPMIRLASIVDDTYEPYTGGIPSPNHDYPQELESVGDSGSVSVTVCGKNLFDGKNVGYIDINSGKLVTYEIYRTTDFIPMTEAIYGFHTEGMFNVGKLNIAFYDSEKNYIGYGLVNVDGFATFTRKYENAVFMRAVCLLEYIGVTYLYENCPAASEYEPYNGGTVTVSTPNGLPGIPVTSGGNYTDENGQQWICDEVDFERGVYVQRCIKKHYTSNNVLNYYSSNTGDMILTLEWADTASGEKGKTLCLCDKLQATDGDAQWITGGDTCAIVYDGRVNIAFKGCATTTDAKAKLDEIGGVDILYILPTPIEAPLTAEELAQYAVLHTNYPNTTIFNDGGAGIEVKYVADTKLYIDKKFAELSAALLNQ